MTILHSTFPNQSTQFFYENKSIRLQGSCRSVHSDNLKSIIDKPIGINDFIKLSSETVASNSDVHEIESIRATPYDNLSWVYSLETTQKHSIVFSPSQFSSERWEEIEALVKKIENDGISII